MAGLSDFVSLSITIIFCIMLSAINVILSKAKGLARGPRRFAALSMTMLYLIV